jgi:Ca2+-binding RTX toxin-like protein
MAPGPAAGATVVGRAAVPTGDCMGGFTRLQTATALYTVPSVGVLTSWSFAAGTTPRQLRLKVGRSTGGANFTIVGESPFETVTANASGTFPVRIPVQGGDVLGHYETTNGRCSMASAGFAFHYVMVDQPSGSSATFEGPVTNIEVPLAANLEPDADRDGFGDETQDACDIGAKTQLPCACKNRPATIAGGPGRDRLKGTPAADIIDGLGGKDTIKGRKGNDIICGGPGKDRIIGGPGKDKLVGGPGKDTQVQ